jgi:hypothetical protein
MHDWLAPPYARHAARHSRKGHDLQPAVQTGVEGVSTYPSANEQCDGARLCAWTSGPNEIVTSGAPRWTRIREGLPSKALQGPGGPAGLAHIWRLQAWPGRRIARPDPRSTNSPRAKGSTRRCYRCDEQSHGKRAACMPERDRQMQCLLSCWSGCARYQLDMR